MRFTGYVLVFVHAVLLLWSAGGFLEMILTKVPWRPFTNPEFPFWVLMIHWSSVLFASVSFLYGYFAKWDKTPQIMAVAYGFMSSVCVIETLGYMTGRGKYIAMAAEFLTYSVILLLLFKNRYFIDRFGPENKAD